MSAPPRHAHARVGLLGGSFNPAHGGHREISIVALESLALDAVWWLVSPGSPLKDQGDYLPYEERLWRARRIADHPRIVVSNFEERRKLRFTVETLAALIELWPQMRFVWLMGADSLAQFHLWKDWRTIAVSAPIAVFNRPGFERAPEDAPAAIELAAFRAPAAEADRLADAEPPAWVFLDQTRNPAAASDLRRLR
jgi:nicotinate-nucleotide adenylyltransferase